MRFLFGICSWGLGHATRTLPIIRRVIKEGHDVTVVSSGRALDVLKRELTNSAVFSKLEDYNPPETSYSSFLVPATVLHFPIYLRAMFREHEFVRRFILDNKIDVIVSDNRFAFYSRNIPSFFISHQLRILNPLGSIALENGSEIYNGYFLKRYAGIIVPDFEEDGIAGRLAHDLSRIDQKRLTYIGVLSDFAYHPAPQDIDVFVSISGPEPHRTTFERLTRSQLDSYRGNVVFSLGKPEANDNTGSNVRVYLERNKREELLNRSKIVISSSGFSTIMDLFSLRKRGFLIPTPGQTEQEYLAQYHMERKSFYCVSEQEMSLPNQLGDALSFHAPILKYPPEKSVEKAVDLITQTAKIESVQTISAG